MPPDGRCSPASALAAIVALGNLWAPGCLAGETRWTPIEVTAVARDLRTTEPRAAAIGRLQYRGGLDLSSRDERFGGFSDLHFAPETGRILAVSDAGFWFEAELVMNEDGWAEGIQDARMAPLTDADGAPLTSKRAGDAEALSVADDGTALVAFEQRHRIWRYLAFAKGAAAPEMVGESPLPESARHAPANQGIEALVASAGETLALNEGGYGDDQSPGYLYRDGVWHDLLYSRGEAYHPTGAARLPNGDIVVLERRLIFPEGFSARLRLIEWDRVEPGATLAPQTLGVLAPPLLVDNFEGVTAWRDEGGRTLLALISDDNYSWLEKTLILVFELK